MMALVFGTFLKKGERRAVKVAHSCVFGLSSVNEFVLVVIPSGI